MASPSFMCSSPNITTFSGIGYTCSEKIFYDIFIISEFAGFYKYEYFDAVDACAAKKIISSVSGRLAGNCEFRCEKLMPCHEYAMYPQLTETVDVAMPVTVAPDPDSMLRIWFAFVQDEAPAVQTEPEPFIRKGLSAVEWGGFFLSPKKG